MFDFIGEGFGAKNGIFSGNAIVVTSGKGGTGKTAVTSMLVSCLSSFGRKVLCVDADAGLKNLDLCLGISDISLYDYGDVISGRCRLEDAVTAHPDIPNLYFLTAPLESTEAGLPDIIADAKQHYDYVFIDSPAGLGQGFREAAIGADAAIIVSSTDPSSCRDANRTVQELEALGITDVRLILNRVQPSILRSIKENLDDMVDRIGARLLGYIPEDKNVILAAAKGIPLTLFTQKGSASAALRIAKRIDGQKVPIK
jgi:septum site-determining protein MinD